jgi:hypothetical protein
MPTPSVTFTLAPTLPEKTEIVGNTPAPIFTPVPTIPAEDAYNLLASWFQNNNDCQLPCWGGLIPGESSSLEAYTKLTTLGSIADDFNYLHPTGGDVVITYPSDDLKIRILVEINSKADRRTMEVVRISTYTVREIPGGYEDVYNAPAYNKMMGAYALNSILSKYGFPTEVLVRADIYTTGAQETFSITLLYPENGIFVRYNMLAERMDDQVYGCPSHSFIDLWLLSPEDAGAYQEILLSSNVQWEGIWSYTTPIQEAASMSIETFYQTYLKSTDACLKTPLNIWPDH